MIGQEGLDVVIGILVDTAQRSNRLGHETKVVARYATFLLARKKPGGEKMVGFTRILHRSSEDVLIAEVGCNQREL